MYDKKFIWLGTLVAVGIISSSSVVAQTNQSDATGGQTVNAPTVNIDSQNGNGISPTTQLNPVTGEIVGGGIETPVQINNSGGGESGSVTFDGSGGGGEPRVVTLDEGEGETRSVTINEVAEALNSGLEKSLDNLSAAEQNAELADTAPRRIARKSAVSDRDLQACVNPVYEARDVVERQLVESEKFIEQVNQIEPQKNIW